jgi:hypothetical protein
METAEVVIKEMTAKTDDFRVIQRGSLVESINKTNQVFHVIDLAYAKQGIFFHSWIGYRTVDQLKQVLDGHFAKLYAQYKCKGMVIEISRMEGSFASANDWFASYFMPKLVSYGMQYSAVVLPANVFAQLAVDDWNNKVGGFITRNFGSANEALAWLRSV